MENRNQRTIFLTTLAGIAILMVVFNHLRAFYYERTYLHVSGAVYDFTLLSWSDQILDMFIDFPVAIFIFVSGFKLAYNLKHHLADEKFQAKSFYFSRLRKLLIPYLIWSVFYLLVGTALHWIKSAAGMEAYESLFTKQYLIGFLVGVGNFAYQLWFIPLLIVISFIVVTIKFVLKQPWILYVLYAGYYLILIFAPHWMDSEIPVRLWLQFLIVYDAGLILGQKYRQDGSLPQLWYFGLAWLVIAGFRMYNRHSEFDALFKAALQPLTPLVLYYLTTRLAFLRTNRLLNTLGDCSWPIYLLHAPILTNLINSFSERLGMVSPWFDFLKGAIIVATCIAVVKILDMKIPKLAKIIF